jgi:hypothetical protein
MSSFIVGLGIAVLLIVGTIFVYNQSYITSVADVDMPGVHVSAR